MYSLKMLGINLNEKPTPKRHENSNYEQRQPAEKTDRGHMPSLLAQAVGDLDKKTAVLPRCRPHGRTLL